MEPTTAWVTKNNRSVVEEEIVEEVIETEEVEQQEEWVKTIDPTSGHTYLYNSITKESKWENEEDGGLEDEKKLETSVNPLHVLEEENDEDWKYMYDETYEAGYVRPFSNSVQQENLLQGMELASLMAVFLTLWAASIFSTYPKCEDPNEAGKTIVWCDLVF